MHLRNVAANLFFVLAGVFALIGAVLFRHNTIGAGLTAEDYLNPLFWITIPRLVPFAASILSVCFGLAYVVCEKHFKFPPNTYLAITHLILYVLAIFGHSRMLRYWWQATSPQNTAVPPIPLWAGFFASAGFTACLVAFGTNVLWSRSRIHHASTTSES